MAGKRAPRKLLVASLGVATINYVLAGCSGVTVANLPAPPAGGKAGAAGSKAGGTAGASAGTPASGGFPTVANLPAPFVPMGGSSGGNDR
jgi:hypothetical protein